MLHTQVEATLREDQLSRKKYKRSKKKRVHSPGIEPGSPAWQADIMPLDHECLVDFEMQNFLQYRT
jgi:hypothetical protein